MATTPRFFQLFSLHLFRVFACPQYGLLWHKPCRPMVYLIHARVPAWPTSSIPGRGLRWSSICGQGWWDRIARRPRVCVQVEWWSRHMRQDYKCSQDRGTYVIIPLQVTFTRWQSPGMSVGGLWTPQACAARYNHPPYRWDTSRTQDSMQAMGSLSCWDQFLWISQKCTPASMIIV